MGTREQLPEHQLNVAQADAKTDNLPDQVGQFGLFSMKFLNNWGKRTREKTEETARRGLHEWMGYGHCYYRHWRGRLFSPSFFFINIFLNGKRHTNSVIFLKNSKEPLLEIPLKTLVRCSALPAMPWTELQCPGASGRYLECGHSESRSRFSRPALCLLFAQSDYECTEVSRFSFFVFIDICVFELQTAKRIYSRIKDGSALTLCTFESFFPEIVAIAWRKNPTISWRI